MPTNEMLDEMLDQTVKRIRHSIQHLKTKFHASEPIRTTVVDTPYRGGVLCLMWWIRHTEPGYYGNVVGHYAAPLYGVSTTSSIIPASVWRIHHSKGSLA